MTARLDVIKNLHHRSYGAWPSSTRAWELEDGCSRATIVNPDGLRRRSLRKFPTTMAAHFYAHRWFGRANRWMQARDWARKKLQNKETT